MYAIVDIETTGGHASSNGITEVAICIHNGDEIIDRYETLINPGVPIPYFINALTGISNEMVSHAPSFKEVAHKIYNLLFDKIFVAHNVNFDYSFLRYHLSSSGFDLQTKKLCTVRLGRKILPGLPSYSLGKFCKHLGIVNNSRHRAAGDAEATAILFSMLLKNDLEGHIQKSLCTRSKEQSLPPHLSRNDIDMLPSTPGVYYFNNLKGKVIYVGKAKNIKKRVTSHFSNNNPGRQKQEFMREVFSVTYKECGTELMALIHEAIEIKRLWPASNRALKHYEHAFGLYVFEDQRGYKRLAIDKVRKSLPCIYTFNLLSEGHLLLNKLAKEFNLCLRLCFIQKSNICQFEKCPVCVQKETSEFYNLRVNDTISGLKKSLPSFIVIDEGRMEQEKSCLLMENGKFFGSGFLHTPFETNNIEKLKSQLTPYPSNAYIRNLIYNHAERYPAKIIKLSDDIRA